MTGRQITLLALGLSGALLLAAEARAIATAEQGDTISAVAHSAAIDYPATVGLLAAPVVHFATPTRLPGQDLPWWQGVGVALIGGALLGLAWPRYDKSRSRS
jgi:hypothetical protein